MTFAFINHYYIYFLKTLLFKIQKVNKIENPMGS